MGIQLAQTGAATRLKNEEARVQGGYPLPLLSLLPFLPLFIPLPLEVGPLKSSQGVWGGISRNRIWCILALKYDTWWQQF